MSGTKKTTQQTSSNQHTVQGPEPWMKAEGSDIYSQLKPLAERDWQGYGGERVADLGADWDTSRDLITQLIGQTGDIDSSRSMLDSLRNSPGNDPTKTVQDYMNPYVDGVLGGTLRDLGHTFDARRLATDRAATMAGAFGDSGHGIQSAQDYRNHEDQVSDTSYRAHSDAYDKGQAQQNTVLGRLMAMPGMYQNLDAAGFNRNTTLARYMNQFAGQDQALHQAKDNVGYSDFLEQRGYKANNLDALMASLNRVPHDTTSNTQGNSTTIGTQQDNSGLQLLGKLGGTVLGGIFGGPAGAGIGGSLGGLLGGGGTSTSGGGLFGGGNLFNQGSTVSQPLISGGQFEWAPGAYK